MIPQHILVCPSCANKLISQAEIGYACSSCGTIYKKIFNIVDFVGGDLGEDRKLVELLLNNYDKSYEELIALKHGGTTHPLSKKFLSIDTKLLERNSEKRDIIFESAGIKTCPTFLEMGCGIGSAIHSMAEIADYAIGVDLSMSSLLLANKVLEERHRNNVLLIRASIDKLPLIDNSFDVVFSTDVIEHVSDQSGFIRSGHDKVKPQGKFIFNSPNRYSLLSPEPHVGVWFVGFVPRKFMNSYVHLIRKMTYEDKRLLSYFELKGLIKKLGLGGEIKGMLKSDLQGASKNKLKCEVLRRFPLGLPMVNFLLRYFIPSYNVVIVKD